MVRRETNWYGPCCGHRRRLCGPSTSILAAEEPSGDADGESTSILPRWAELLRSLTARLCGLPYNAAALQACLDVIDPTWRPGWAACYTPLPVVRTVR